LGVSVSLGGCESEGYFPQYSGLYRLVETVPFSNSAGDYLNPPATIRITQRMYWVPNTWNHQIAVAAISPASGEAKGTWTGSLSDLLDPGEKCELLKGAACRSGGVSFKFFKAAYSGGDYPGCDFYGYEYIARVVSAVTSPDPKLLEQIYTNHGKLLKGSNPPAYETLVDPKKGELDSAAVSEWTKQIAKQKTTLAFSFSKLPQENNTGCQNGRFPIGVKDDDANSSMVVIYERVDADEWSDIRSAPKLTEDPSAPGNLFDQMTQFE
jgi:hypothetical protein